MTAEILVRPHDELTIEPEALCPIEEITRNRQAEATRGRDFWCYDVPSASAPGTWHLVVYNRKRRELYCTCEAGQRGQRCRHAKSLLFKHAYDETYRLYHAATLPDLQEQERTFIEMGLRTLVPIRGYRAMWAALGDLIAERTKREAA